MREKMKKLGSPAQRDAGDEGTVRWKVSGMKMLTVESALQAEPGEVPKSNSPASRKDWLL